MCMKFFTSYILKTNSFFIYRYFQSCQHQKNFLILFLCSLEKGGILFCNCRSVFGWYVGWSVGPLVCLSVDQVLSAQYLLTPSLDQYQTWCSGCPQWVDDPYWFSGHVFKSQGQTTLLCPLCCLLNIFWPFHLINTKLGAGVAPK